MRKWILNVHLYGLLVCSGYLIIFGVSSIDFNHKFSFTQPDSTRVHWKKSLVLDSGQENLALAESLRESLGLMGWNMPWKMDRDSSGIFTTAIARPSKHYYITYYPENGLVEVTEERRGVWEIFRGLHGFTHIPGSTFLSIWNLYTEICTWFVIFGAVSGTYLWATRKSERKVGLFVVIVAFSVSSLLMLYIWFAG